MQPAWGNQTLIAAAAADCLRKCLSNAQCRLLEPLAEVEVQYNALPDSAAAHSHLSHLFCLPSFNSNHNVLIPYIHTRCVRVYANRSRATRSITVRSPRTLRGAADSWWRRVAIPTGTAAAASPRRRRSRRRRRRQAAEARARRSSCARCVLSRSSRATAVSCDRCAAAPPPHSARAATRRCRRTCRRNWSTRRSDSASCTKPEPSHVFQ